MLIPPTNFQAPPGIAVYPQQLRVDDTKTDRGEFVFGTRVDSAVYLTRKDGDYTLPEIRIEWWDLARRRVQTATLSAIHFTAAPNPNYNPELAPEPAPVAAPAPQRSKSVKRYLYLGALAIVLLVGLALLGGCAFTWGPVSSAIGSNPNACTASLSMLSFAKLQNACNESKPKEAYVNLLAWLNRFSPGVGLNQFLSDTNDLELRKEVEALGSSLYWPGTTASWSSKRMIAALRRVRTHHREKSGLHPALPPFESGYATLILHRSVERGFIDTLNYGTEEEQQGSTTSAQASAIHKENSHCGHVCRGRTHRGRDCLCSPSNRGRATRAGFGRISGSGRI